MRSSTGTNGVGEEKAVSSSHATHPKGICHSVVLIEGNDMNLESAPLVTKREVVTYARQM